MRISGIRASLFGMVLVHYLLCLCGPAAVRLGPSDVKVTRLDHLGEVVVYGYDDHVSVFIAHGVRSYLGRAVDYVHFAENKIDNPD